MPAIGRHVSRLAGYAPALPTPFGKSGGIDTAAFEELCRRQIQLGATALVVGGTTGEAPTLAPAEHVTLIQIAVGVARSRVPVIAGAGSNSTSHAIELTKEAEAAGAGGILSIVPYYNKPTQAGLYEHFRAIAQSTGLPIFLYDVPSRTSKTRPATSPVPCGFDPSSARISGYSRAMMPPRWHSCLRAAKAAFPWLPMWHPDCAGRCFWPAGKAK